MAHYQTRIQGLGGDAIAGAGVYFFQRGTANAAVTPPTGTLPTGNMRSGSATGAVISNPVLTDSGGGISVWFDTAQDLDVVVTSNNGTAYYATATSTPLSFSNYVVADEAYQDPAAGLNSTPPPPDYVLWFDGTTYRARSALTGTDTVNASFATLLNGLIATNNTWVHIRAGTYPTTATITPSTGTILTGEGPTTVIQAASPLASTSVVVDFYNGGNGLKWVQIRDLWIDGNNIAGTCLRMLGVVADTSQWNLAYRVGLENFTVVGLVIDDFSTAGGTRQYFRFSKIGPGLSSVNTRGADLAANDLHFLDNDIFGVNDVGIYLRARAGTSALSNVYLIRNHINVFQNTFIGGGVSPSAVGSVNIFSDCGITGGIFIEENYLDDIGTGGAIWFKPVAGSTQKGITIASNWFNGVRLATDNAAYCVVVDGTNVGATDIYDISVIDNMGSGGTAAPTSNPARFAGILSVQGGLAGLGFNLSRNSVRACLSIFNTAGAHPRWVDQNQIQPYAGVSFGGPYYSDSKGTFTGGAAAATTWTIPHGLSVAPTFIEVTPVNGTAALAMANGSWAITSDATNIYLVTAAASITSPTWNWRANI